MAAAAARSGFRRMFSISAFAPPKPPAPRPQADPSPNLFVSGLSKRTSTEGLRDAFAKFGEVVHARVVTDRVSGCSKGFGFVSSLMGGLFLRNMLNPDHRPRKQR
ncbi:hypothetical protein PVAP13_6NG034400 [Panicum virgatum]|uniref:RRM domain-containing protein n=1 Tax=Panicum virgatum TaxID=38727 RepID=A0A8T0QTQ8_PANVG|nr:hypothetical protein PVAP13_6NG034400 [Panicum virgatum]